MMGVDHTKLKLEMVSTLYKKVYFHFLWYLKYMSVLVKGLSWQSRLATQSVILIVFKD